MKRFSIALAIFACIIVGSFFALKKGTNASNTDTLRVGIIIGYKPFAMLNDAGQLEGFDIDVANVVARKLNKTIAFKGMELAPLLVALEQGNLDMVLTSLCITKEREQRIAMVKYSGEAETQYPLVFWENMPEKLQTLDALAQDPQAIVCVEPGSVQEKFLKNEYPTMQTRTLGNITNIVLDLKYGKSVAALLDPQLYPTYKKQVPQLVDIAVNLPEQYQTRGIGIGINKQNTPLIANVTQAIAELRADGTIAQFEQHWLEAY